MLVQHFSGDINFNCMARLKRNKRQNVLGEVPTCFLNFRSKLRRLILAIAAYCSIGTEQLDRNMALETKSTPFLLAVAFFCVTYFFRYSSVSAALRIENVKRRIQLQGSHQLQQTLYNGTYKIPYFLSFIKISCRFCTIPNKEGLLI